MAEASGRKTVTVSIDSDEFKDLLQDSVKVELERLENEVRDKDQKLSEAQAEIEELRLSQQLMEKDIEQLTEVYSKLEKELKLTDSLLERKNRELKSCDLERKATILYLSEAKWTLAKVETAHKKDEAELILAREQIAKLQNDTKELDKLRLSQNVFELNRARYQVAKLHNEKVELDKLNKSNASMVHLLKYKNEELMKYIEKCQEDQKVMAGELVRARTANEMGHAS
ncbi:Microtubule-associated protein 70 [Artemisia annua]|nr:Microtubule-associated protein 70 [Artemisia annua]